MPNLTLFLSELWIETELLLGLGFLASISLYLWVASARVSHQTVRRTAR
jgi:hypothetical protein